MPHDLDDESIFYPQYGLSNTPAPSPPPYTILAQDCTAPAPAPAPAQAQHPKSPVRALITFGEGHFSSQASTIVARADPDDEESDLSPSGENGHVDKRQQSDHPLNVIQPSQLMLETPAFPWSTFETPTPITSPSRGPSRRVVPHPAHASSVTTVAGLPVHG